MAKKVSILVGSLRKGSFARKVAQNVFWSAVQTVWEPS